MWFTLIIVQKFVSLFINILNFSRFYTLFLFINFFFEEKNKTRVFQSAIWENIGGLETLCLLTEVSLTGWRFHTKYL